MADEGRWIATIEGKPIKIDIENLDDLVNNKPVPVVGNIPLDEYLEQQKKIENLSKQIEQLESSKSRYYKVLHRIFGSCDFLKSLNPELLEVSFTNDEVADRTIISIKIPNKYYNR